MDELLRELLNALDLIGETNEEIYDSECRERMSGPIFHLFIKPSSSYEMPVDFGLLDENANQRVQSALSRYIDSANDLAQETGTVSFHARLSAFQNGDVASQVERNYFDDFFGWSNPDHFDAQGNVILDSQFLN